MGAQDTFSLPRMHSIVHYKKRICQFGAPNGICTSITKNKHIDAVKKPWRCSNRYNALSQMLITNSRLDKLRASCLSFLAQGMIQNLFLDEDGANDVVVDNNNL